VRQTRHGCRAHALEGVAEGQREADELALKVAGEFVERTDRHPVEDREVTQSGQGGRESGQAVECASADGAEVEPFEL